MRVKAILRRATGGATKQSNFRLDIPLLKPLIRLKNQLYTIYIMRQTSADISFCKSLINKDILTPLR